MLIKRIIDQLLQKKSITNIEAKQVIQSALNGGATPAQITAFFTAMLMKGITHTEFEGMIKGIKYEKAYDNKRSIDFYVYSFTQSNIVLLICFLLSQLKYSVYGKFKNLYSENTEFFRNDDMLNISNEQITLFLDKFQFFLSLSDYNKTLKNLLFLKTELNFTKIFTLFEMSIIPIKDTKQIILMDEKTMKQFQNINNLCNLLTDKLIIIISEYEIRLLRIKEYKIVREKIIKLHELERYHFCSFSFAVKNANFMLILQAIVEEILGVFNLKNTILNNLNDITREETSKKILISSTDYFQEMSYIMIPKKIRATLNNNQLKPI